MPRQIADDDVMPRRRRGAKAVAIEAEEERGLVMRMLLHSPKDMVAGALAVAASAPGRTGCATRRTDASRTEAGRGQAH